MYYPWRYISAVVVLAAYITAGVLLEVTHRDVHDLLLQSQPVLAQHECGANEIHVPIERMHHCLACMQSSQRLSTEVPPPVSINACFVYLVNPSLKDEHPYKIDVRHSGKRGPPTFSV
jgi:hypothetical protein